jgi:hypothetical protein
MQKHGRIVATSLGLGLGLCALVAAGAWAQDKQDQGAKPGEYWIGVQVQYPLPDLMRAQLSIPKDEGILVQEVEPSTPADGKLMKHDVLVKADGKPLKSASDLVSAVNEAKGGKLQLEVLRGGKPVKIEVTPAKRPAALPSKADVWVSPELRYKDLAEALKLSGPGLRYYTMRPGWILRPGALHHAPLPENLSITITKEGSKPAKIVVKQDQKQWEIAENELDKLPTDVRPYVDQMLGLAPGWLNLESAVRPHRLEVVPPGGSKVIVRPQTEKRIEEMSRQLDQLRKSLDELRAQTPPPPPKVEHPK